MSAKVEKHKSFNKTKWLKMFDKFYMQYILADNATFLQCKFLKGCIVPQHMHHRNEEILHIVKGQLDCFIGPKKKKYTVKEGETIVIPPKNLHGWRAVKYTITYEVFSPPRTKAQMEKLAKRFKQQKHV